MACPQNLLACFDQSENSQRTFGHALPLSTPDNNDYDYDVNNDHDSQLCKQDYHMVGDCEDVLIVNQSACKVA